MGLTALREAQVNAALLTGGGLGSQTEPKRRQKPNSLTLLLEVGAFPNISLSAHPERARQRGGQRSVRTCPEAVPLAAGLATV